MMILDWAPEALGFLTWKDGCFCCHTYWKMGYICIYFLMSPTSQTKVPCGSIACLCPAASKLEFWLLCWRDRAQYVWDCSVKSVVFKGCWIAADMTSIHHTPKVVLRWHRRGVLPASYTDHLINAVCINNTVLIKCCSMNTCSVFYVMSGVLWVAKAYIKARKMVGLFTRSLNPNILEWKNTLKLIKTWVWTHSV